MQSRIPPKVSRRIGNWCEEAILREEKLKEFLSKIESGEISFHKRDMRVALAKAKTELSSNLICDANLMIKSNFTAGFLSIHIPDHYPSLRSTDKILLTTSLEEGPHDPHARATFRIQRHHDLGPGVSNKPTYGEKVYIVAYLPKIDQPLYLASDLRTPINFSKVSKNQTVYLTPNKSIECLWSFDWFDGEYRLEMEMTTIQPGMPVLIKHAHTGTYLYSSPSDIVRNDFGVEYEVSGKVAKDHGSRQELPMNMFSIILHE